MEATELIKATFEDAKEFGIKANNPDQVTAAIQNLYDQINKMRERNFSEEDIQKMFEFAFDLP